MGRKENRSQRACWACQCEPCGTLQPAIVPEVDDLAASHRQRNRNHQRGAVIELAVQVLECLGSTLRCRKGSDGETATTSNSVHIEAPLCNNNNNRLLNEAIERYPHEAYLYSYRSQVQACEYTFNLGIRHFWQLEMEQMLLLMHRKLENWNQT